MGTLRGRLRYLGAALARAWPMVPGLWFVALGWGQVPCQSCHEEVLQALRDTPHARVAARDVAFCESCHGDTKAHVESGDPAGLVGKQALASWGWQKKAQACLSCHGRQWPQYAASSHAAADACWQCHAVQALHFGERVALRQSSEVCGQCHRDVMGSFRLPYRHPLAEGFMTCVSCHAVHEPAPLEGERRTCVKCHREQAGPFVFSHAPAQEGCVSCHAPHGTAHRGMLKSFGNGLCLSCHTQSNFPAVGKVPHNYWLGGGGRCWDCHSQVHGSNVTPDLNPRGRR